MAITRAQQFKQLLAQGGRTGFQGGGKDASTRSFAESQGRSRAEVSQLGRDFGFSGRDVAGDSGRQRPDSASAIAPLKKPKIKKETFSSRIRKFIPPTASFFNFLGNKIGGTKLARMNNALQRQNFLRTLSPEEQVEALEDLAKIGIGTDNPMGITRNIDRGMEDKGFLGTGIGGGKFITDLDLGDPEAEAVLNQFGYDDYLNRNKKDFEPDGVSDPCLGPNPPAYCFVGIRSAEPKVEEPEYVNPLSKLASRIAGSRFAAKGGGIASLEDMDREAFILGGVAKGLKKATRAIKKIAKSPIGKAALIGGLGYFGGGGGLPKFLGGKGLGGFSAKTLFSSKNPLLFTDGKLSFAKTMGLSSILALLEGKTEEEKKDILKDYYESQELTPSTTIRQAGSEFDFYNYNLAEGGTPRKEPVAKKVMPLLDMGGMEKDYRAEGGFVPIGRMEKADDVPARLSKNEFVFTADAVRNAGDGDVDKGAEVMYNMMKNLEAGGEVSEESQGLEGARKMFQTSQRLEEVL